MDSSGLNFRNSLERLHNEPERAEFIVEFVEEPFFVARAKAGVQAAKASLADYQSSFAEFERDVNSAQSLLKQSAGAQTEITRKYYKTFFGAAITTSPRNAAILSLLPYVKKVHSNKEVRAYIDNSLPQIGVPHVIAAYGKKGEGVKVGVIDSGIDYLHPCLGGGLGPGFKVKGGYDLVNNDADPMDDNGHGSHVAGIVGADGTVKGVAPLVSLYAYKVLNERGSGSEANVIAAIELAADPNGDGDESDRMDVLNLSLGSDEAFPDDPGVIAVNNAVLIGMTVCVSAGNSGFRNPPVGKENNYYYNGSATVGSPGIAELAVTVGAVDSLDALAYFSSKGPVRRSFALKPDVLAPGVMITSSYLNGSVKSLSGTSMATPFVAGVAALLKSIHPEWTPARVKSALIASAKDLGMTPYKQGGGRLQADKAVAMGAFIDTPVVSFGMDDPGGSTWNKSVNITVHNQRGVAQTFSTLITGTQGGISLTATPSSFAVNSNDSVTVTLALSVNNGTVLTENQNILLFSGRVAFFGTADTLALPWGFARTNRLSIVLSEPDVQFMGYSATNYFESSQRDIDWVSPTRADIYGSVKDTYEFHTVFRRTGGAPRVVLKEFVSVTGDAQTVSFDASTAVHPIVYKGVDHKGTPLSAYPNRRKVMVASMPNFGEWVTLFSPGGSDTVYYSNASTRYAFRPLEHQYDLKHRSCFHLVQYPMTTGMSGGRTLSNFPSAFAMEKFRIEFPPATSRAAVIPQFYSYRQFGGEDYHYGIGYGIDTLDVSGNMVEFSGYFGEATQADADVSVGFFASYADVNRLSVDYETFQVMRDGSQFVPITKKYALASVPRYPSGSVMTYGGGPIQLLTVYFNNTFGPGTLHFDTRFRGMLREMRYRNVNYGTYAIYDAGGTKVFESPLNDFPRSPRQLNPSPYSFVVKSNHYWLRGIQGELAQTSWFDLSQTSPNPPSVTSYIVFNSANLPTDGLPHLGSGTLQFSTYTIDLMTNVMPIADSARAWYRIHGTMEWIPLTVTKKAEVPETDGLVMQADLSPALGIDSSAVDIRIYSKGLNGAWTENVLSPAFAVGRWGFIPSGTNENPEAGVPLQYSLAQNYPNPFNPETVIEYTLAKSGNVTFKVFDILGRTVASQDEGYKTAGALHRLRFRANGLASGVYFYRLEVHGMHLTKRFILVR